MLNTNFKTVNDRNKAIVEFVSTHNKDSEIKHKAAKLFNIPLSTIRGVCAKQPGCYIKYRLKQSEIDRMIDMHLKGISSIKIGKILKHSATTVRTQIANYYKNQSQTNPQPKQSLHPCLMLNINA